MKKILPWVLFGTVIIVIFHPFFSFREIAGGDFPHFYKEQVKEFSLPLSSWITNQRLGAPVISPWIDTYVSAVIVIFVNTLHIPWTIVQIVFFFSLATVLSLLSSYYLVRTLFGKGSIVASFIYTCNTYFLLILSGGQIGIVLAYSVAPLVLLSFIKLINSFPLQTFNIKHQTSKIKYSIIAGMFFSVQVMFDIRIAYITLAAAILYLVLSIRYLVLRKNILNTLYLILYTIVIPLGITGLLHASWLLPLLIYKQNPLDALGAMYSSQEVVKFFSFATFSQTLSLLHPNWPENIFGKVSFMKAEFLVLPILAYTSLLFLKSKIKTQKSKLQLKTKNFNNVIIEKFNNEIILFFALLGLIGAFLVKGASEPFGGIYLWLFDYIPGFVMFRDPTKWYLLVAISYSVLIPFSIWRIYEWLKLKIKNEKLKIQIGYQKYIPNLFLLFAFLYLIFLIHPALLGQLGGTFKSQSVPKEYIQLKEYIISDQSFFRSLWIPYLQRFGIQTQQHPHVSGYQLFLGISDQEVIRKLQNPSTEKLLQEAAIRYVIVPYDSEGEIFLNDRKYSEKEYKKVIKSIEAVPYLTKRKEFGKIVVFEVLNPKGHFWVPSSTLRIQYEFINPTKYLVSVKGAKKGDRLVFSESYNPGWKAKQNNVFLASSPYSTPVKQAASLRPALSPNIKLNSFVLPEDGSYELEVFYEPQKCVEIGLSISLVSMFVLFGYLIVVRRK